MNCFQLPSIIWRKESNSPNKFMGSGMLPNNAYVTLEHEYILLFRKGISKKIFPPKQRLRYRSAYFWEERNKWFSDVWMDIKGTSQNLNIDVKDIRDRSAAFPLELPLRLISMYSIQSDTIVDPFWGTGTTSIAAMLTGRNSIGFELNSSFETLFQSQMSNLTTISENYVNTRLAKHQKYIEQQLLQGKQLKYLAENYQIPVKTRQELHIYFPMITKYQKNDSSYTVFYQ